MKRTEDNSGNDKISRPFAARLDALGPEDKVRAVVLLVTKNPRRSIGRRQNSGERQAAVKALRKTAQQGLNQVDYILQRFGGKRLVKSPDALGSITVETTAAGINALAASDRVKAIMEDQEIHPVI